MQSVVNRQEFVNALKSICTAKQILNFTIDRGVLHLQVMEPVIVSIPVNILSLKSQYVGDTYSSISVEMNNSYELLPEEDESVYLEIGKETLTVRSSGYECIYKSAYEDRFNTPTTFSSQFESLDTSYRLENVVRVCQYTSIFSRYLKESESAVTVKDGVAYNITGPLAIKSTLNFPDSMWLRKTLRAMNSLFNEYHINEPTLKINNSSGVYGVINFGENKDMAFSMKFSHNTQIDAINAVIEKMEEPFTVNVGSLAEKVKIIEKTYKKAKVLITLGDGSYHIRVVVGSEQELNIGRVKIGAKLHVLDASIPLLSLISNMYKNSGNVEIGVNGRYVMFKDSMNTLVTTGITSI